MDKNGLNLIWPNSWFMWYPCKFDRLQMLCTLLGGIQYKAAPTLCVCVDS